MKKLVMACVIAATLTTTGCASIFSGTSQDIRVATNDDTAVCKVQGLNVPSSGSVKVSKGSDDLLVTCETPDGKRGNGVAGSSLNPLVMINFFNLIAHAVDFGSDAAWKYDSVVNVEVK